MSMKTKIMKSKAFVLMLSSHVKGTRQTRNTSQTLHANLLHSLLMHLPETELMQLYTNLLNGGETGKVLCKTLC